MAQIGIIGGGPAGLMAAETLSAQGHTVKVFEAMPTVGRKFLMAGKSGLNITHAEPHGTLLSRFGAATPALQAALDGFTNDQIRDWCTGLGIETFVGSSGRVFPVAMKASPLLRAWLARLAGQGVSIHPRHHWRGFAEAGLVFDTPQGPQTLQFDAVVLALGGASWPKLGSDAAWVPFLADRGVGITPFVPANCGYERDWSPIFIERFGGAAVKSVVASSAAGVVPGEFVITQWGVEGSLIYAHAAALREALARDGKASLTLDLAPQRSVERLASDLGRQPAKLSFTNRLRKATGIEGVKAGLLRECAPDVASLSPEALEETKVQGLVLHPWHQGGDLPLVIDSHDVPGKASRNEPPHVHHDFQYLFVADAEAPLVAQEDEVHAARWQALPTLAELSTKAYERIKAIIG